MKIVSWNFNGALRKKLNPIDRIGADLLVIQECEDPNKSTPKYKQWAGKYLWNGRDKHKGIGVFSKDDSSLSQLEWSSEGLDLFLPCRVADRFNLLAVWTKKAAELPYVGQLWNYLQLHKIGLSSNPFVVCGDFNSNQCWDKPTRNWNHSNAVQELNEIGANSVYHRHFNELQGAESCPTLYLQQNVNKTYHVDYAFVSNSLYDTGDVRVGDVTEWLQYSDHMPLMFEIS